MYSGVPTETLQELLTALDPAQGEEVTPHKRFVLRHSYEQGDVVLWDNYSL